MLLGGGWPCAALPSVPEPKPNARCSPRRHIGNCLLDRMTVGQIIYADPARKLTVELLSDCEPEFRESREPSHIIACWQTGTLKLFDDIHAGPVTKVSSARRDVPAAPHRNACRQSARRQRDELGLIANLVDTARIIAELGNLAGSVRVLRI